MAARDVDLAVSNVMRFTQYVETVDDIKSCVSMKHRRKWTE